eukprot:TRINITY_DN1082_c1_g2_i1.p1 TRINITY_DN1082_c1_g2~~TRINITY_DN1082_c1_g2_i1.p1  ORF type:complete len:281 (+),score=25.11 TRINITY_DN1082_c1_g2_i1:54-845(+)
MKNCCYKSSFCKGLLLTCLTGLLLAIAVYLNWVSIYVYYQPTQIYERQQDKIKVQFKTSQHRQVKLTVPKIEDSDLDDNFIEFQREGIVVLDFTYELPIRFMTQNDDMEGGTSTGEISYDQQEKSAVFSGATMTTNGGGYSGVMSLYSIRFKIPEREGVRLVIKGDGRTYRLSAKTSGRYYSPIYYHDFETKNDGEYMVVELLFRNFVPQFLGSPINSYTLLNSGEIVQLGFMHSKFNILGAESLPNQQQGKFQLFIKSVEYI